jgi:hypothetical protein
MPFKQTIQNRQVLITKQNARLNLNYTADRACFQGMSDLTISLSPQLLQYVDMHEQPTLQVRGYHFKLTFVTFSNRLRVSRFCPCFSIKT